MELEKLKELRISEKKTYQDVADEIEVTKPYYWQIENGKRGLSYGMAVKIAAVFGKKPDEIFLTSQLTNEEQGCSEDVI
jgi:putative transcriptional regulator